MTIMQSVAEVVKEVGLKTSDDRANVVALHDYVRDNVKFGFNMYFDAASPEYTLRFGYGHCNPKSRLMVALFKAVGLEAYQHFVVIPKAILKGAIPPSQFWMIGAYVAHSYVDVNINGNWSSIDSFIVDTPLLKGGVARLVKEGRLSGYGVRSGSVNTWDGTSNAFSQFDQSVMLEDHGRIEDLESYFHSKKYRNVFLGIRFNQVFKMLGEMGVAATNNNIEEIRQY